MTYQEALEADNFAFEGFNVVQQDPLHVFLHCRFEVRPSMRKFETDADMLEICQFAKHAPGYLNRQIITLLMDKCLGVPDDVFKRLQVNKHSAPGLPI